MPTRLRWALEDGSYFHLLHGDNGTTHWQHLDAVEVGSRPESHSAIPLIDGVGRPCVSPRVGPPGWFSQIHHVSCFFSFPDPPSVFRSRFISCFRTCFLSWFLHSSVHVSFLVQCSFPISFFLCFLYGACSFLFLFSFRCMLFSFSLRIVSKFPLTFPL